MKKKLYYVIEKGYEDDGYMDGTKSVDVFNIVKNVPVNILHLELLSEDDTKDQILDNLDSEKWPDVDLIHL